MKLDKIGQLLLVEADSEQRDLLVFDLNLVARKIFAHASGDEAKETLRSQEIHALICPLTFEGNQIVFQELIHHPHIKLLLLLSHGDPEAEIKRFGLTPQSVIYRPYDRFFLRNETRKALEQGPRP